MPRRGAAFEFRQTRDDVFIDTALREGTVTENDVESA